MRTEEVADLIRDVTERLIAPRFRALADEEVIMKRPGDVVTVADREAETALTAALLAAHPAALIVGEEATFSDPRALAGLAGADHAWVIDPVDGTRNFAAGRDDFGVMIAEVRRGETTRAWIWQPRYGDMYAAERGAGATRNGVLLPQLVAGERPWRAAAWPGMSRSDVVGLQLRTTCGSCAIDYPALARGETDALAYRSVHPWDHLPGGLIVTEVGGLVRLDDSDYRPGTTGRVLVAAASDAVARLLGPIARAGLADGGLRAG